MGCVLQCIYLLYPSSKHSCVVSQVEIVVFVMKIKLQHPLAKLTPKAILFYALECLLFWFLVIHTFLITWHPWSVVFNYYKNRLRNYWLGYIALKMPTNMTKMSKNRTEG